MCFLPSTQPVVKEPYHQTHRPAGILPCPCCCNESCVVYSYDSEIRGHRVFYVACENEECEGQYNGPRRKDVREAVRDNNANLLAFVKLVGGMA